MDNRLFERYESPAADAGEGGLAARPDAPEGEAAMEQSDDPDVRYADEIRQRAERLGMELIGRIAAEFGISEYEASALSDGYMPTGVDEISRRAAKTLVEMQSEGLLKFSPEEYIGDEEFAELLREVSPRAAVRLLEERRHGRKQQESIDNALRLLDRLKRNQSLPRPLRANTPASGERDYRSMSDEQFKRLRDGYRKAAANGGRVRL